MSCYFRFTEEEIDKAVEYLRTSAEDSGRARGRMAYADGNLRRIKALVMLQKEGGVGMREAEAYASDEYKDALEQLDNATADYETIRAKREAAQYACDVWRTQFSGRKAGI